MKYLKKFKVFESNSTIDKIMMLIESGSTVDFDLAFELIKGQNLYQEFKNRLVLDGYSLIVPKIGYMDCKNPTSLGYVKEIVHKILFEKRRIKLDSIIIDKESEDEIRYNIPKVLYKMKKLYSLTIWNCSLLDFTDEMKNLNIKYLTLSNIKEDKLPSVVTEIETLVSLTVENSDIKEIPESISNLKNLNFLTLTSLDNLTKLPKSIGELKNIREFTMSNCRKVNEIPIELTKINTIQELTLTNSNLNDLPKEILNMESLNGIRLRNTKFKNFPEVLFDLKGYYVLDLERTNLDKEKILELEEKNKDLVIYKD